MAAGAPDAGRRPSLGRRGVRHQPGWRRLRRLRRFRWVAARDGDRMPGGPHSLHCRRAALDVSGRGIRAIEDKADGILPYRYHVALENSQFPDYWTEKLADAFLGFAHPLYWGCPNLERYFPAQSFTALNIHDPAQAIAAI